MVNDLDNSAIASLLTRYVKAFETRKAAQEINARVMERIQQANLALANLKVAFSLYDIDTAQEEVWKSVTARIGADLYNSAIRDGLAEAERQAVVLVDKSSIMAPPPPLPPPPPPTRQQEEGEEEDSENGAAEDGEDFEQTTFAGLGEPTQSVREFTIDALRVAGETGIKAADIRQAYESSRNVKLHDKTIGMTLYRLSKDDLARRDGRLWFFVEPKGETKNPGGETPGQFVRRF
ncbi:hypothetical protein [Bradyrhizobium japonicum]|uniref:hypothetical protein n=1 Tax=Bradyrhizobium japonicum TaxID=375 RepID=UPI0004625239|nr:hypothetical protein [Bradyrhizobium japonicum]